MTLSGAGTVAAVIGWPIAHSKSPQLHQYWIDRYNVDGVVVPFAVAPDHLDVAVAALAAMGLAGCSVTLPHKQACIPLLDEVSPLVTTVGACNLIVHKDGKLYGDNTDVFGFAENLKLGAPDANWQRPALVLGAGGAARAVIAGLSELGVPEILIANRTHSRAEALASDMAARLTSKLSAVPWQDAATAVGQCGFLINTTSLGMTGQPPLEIDVTGLSPDCVVNDIVYTPLETDLLRHAAAKGCTTVDGLGMLLHQGRPAFHGWFGVDPQVDEAQRNLVLGIK